jgi:cytochrome c peroxidase
MFSSRRMRNRILFFATLIFSSMSVFGGRLFPNPLRTPNSSGVLATYSTIGGIDANNPFFQNLGTNGRTCNTCHISSSAWGITPADVQEKFNRTQGTDPIFRTNDGSNCPSADVSSVSARRSAYSQLLSKALIRVSVAVPANAEFQIVGIQDPYNCPETTATAPALYRRPLPAANLTFLSTMMWDGRETVFGAIPKKSINLAQSLTNQATDATTGHAQGAAPPTPEQLAQIVGFETGLYSAQISDNRAGDLTARGANGGPIHLSQQDFYVGINDSLGGDPTGASFNPNVFSLYGKWAQWNESPAQFAVVRGEHLFNNLPIPITNVGGLNDALGQEVIMGTCTTCHDSPNAGNHSFSVPLAIGTTAFPAMSALDIAGLPVYSVQCNATAATVQVTDLGRALISGKCADIGKVKGPVLRALAARSPYFHNEAAVTLNDAVNFYDQRFSLSLTAQQKADLVAFLQTL